MNECSVCLSNFREPVCIPCGHVYCKKCLTDYVNKLGNNGLTAECPECRASFELMVPDRTCLPEKYHRFVTHNVRRIYADFASPNMELQLSLKATEDRLARNAATERVLLTRCTALTEALNTHLQGESDANQRVLELETKIAKKIFSKKKKKKDKKMQAQMEAKERDGEDLFLTAKIITDDTFSRHETFDLAVFDDGDQPPSDLPTFCVSKQETYSVFKSRVARHLNFPESQIRLWVLMTRKNKTVRPEICVPENDPSLTLEAIHRPIAVKKRDLWLYLGIFPSKSAMMKTLLGDTDAGTLIFLKHFDTMKQTLVGAGKILVPVKNLKLSILIPLINERMGWASGTLLNLYEEVKPGMVELLLPSRTFSQSGIQDGDIVSFQMVISDEEARDLESRGLYSNSIQFYNSLL